MNSDNLFEEIALYNDKGKQIGGIDRKTAHSSKRYLHGAVHIFVFNSRNELLLQKRSMNKFIMPGRFDISAGGHIVYGEREDIAALRELEEELGIRDVSINFLYSYFWETRIEREYVFTYSTIYNDKINFLKSEIDEVRFFKLEEVKQNDTFTPNLLYEIELLKKRNIKF